MSFRTPIISQLSPRYPSATTQRLQSVISTEIGYMYDSETGKRIPIVTTEDNTDRFEDFNLERAIQAATEYNILNNRISTQHREFYLGEADVAGPIINKRKWTKPELSAEVILKSPTVDVQAELVHPNVAPEIPTPSLESKALELSTALLAGNIGQVEKVILTEWRDWLRQFKAGEIEPPTLMGRVNDLGLDEMKALGLSFVATHAASMMFAGAFALAWSGPISEKVVFLASGFTKFRAISSTNNVPLLMLGTLIMASPNMIADLVFHDSIYTQLAECGFNQGYSGAAVVPFSFMTALACAILLQFAVYKGGYKFIERFVVNEK